MKRSVYITMVLAAALLCGCGNDDPLDPVNGRSPEDTVLFGVNFASAGGSTRASGDPREEGGDPGTEAGDPVYFITKFKDNTTRMRINVGSGPNYLFTRNYKEYIYNYTLETTGKYDGIQYVQNQYNFVPYENSVLKWSEVLTSSTNYTFCAAIFPRTYQAFTDRNESQSKRIDTDQTTLYKLLSNDQLLAYHIHSAVSEDIKLSFYHAMAMLVCKVYIPVYANDDSGQGFPEQEPTAYKSADLYDIADEKKLQPGGFKEAVLLDCSTEFVETTRGGSDTAVKADATETSVKEEVHMCLISIDEPVEIPHADLPPEDKTTGKTYYKQCYTYVVIVPEPKSTSVHGKMLRFVITNPFGYDRTYTYTPKEGDGTTLGDNVKLEGNFYTELVLNINRKSDNPVKVSATVQPWGYVDVDVPVFEVEEGTE